MKAQTYSTAPALALLQPAQATPHAAEKSDILRLVVLVPDGLLDETALAQKVWTLAGNSSVVVQYLGMAASRNRTASLRRMLARLARATAYGHVSSEVRVITGSDWRRKMQLNAKTGDAIVCLASHREMRGLVRGVPLARRLAEDLDNPVHILDGFEMDYRPWRRVAAIEGLAWALAIAVIAGFGWWQTGIPAMATEPLSQIVLGTSVLVELLILWKLNTALNHLK